MINRLITQDKMMYSAKTHMNNIIQEQPEDSSYDEISTGENGGTWAC